MRVSRVYLTDILVWSTEIQYIPRGGTGSLLPVRCCVSTMAADISHYNRLFYGYFLVDTNWVTLEMVDSATLL
jgi:hypothetical protein